MDRSARTRLVVAALGSLLLAPYALAVDTVASLITCPQTVAGKVELPASIGHDPNFTTAPENNHEQLSFTFLRMDQHGQKITCLYSNKAPAPYYRTISYSYTVQRKITSCEKSAPNQLRCFLHSSY